ncbi:MAG: DUF934 domain-containing protein [Pseudomonadota bacterium]
MQNIYRDGRFDPDIWTLVADDEPLPEGGHALIGKARWLEERDVLAKSRLSLGLALAAGDTLDDVVADLPRFSVIALEFPKFADGRSYSTARLLRETHGFKGELRAIGDVLIDQIPLMRRCGFDAFAISNEPTRRALEAGHFPDVPYYTQPIADRGEVPAGTRPWLRVPAAPAPPVR